ncbi:hypothetical protein ACVWZP_000821 [Pseudomonas sp. TE36184]
MRADWSEAAPATQVAILAFYTRDFSADVIGHADTDAA